MLQDTTSVGREAMLDVQQIITDSENMDDLCRKLAQYWNADERGLQAAAIEWKERASTRHARAERASRLLQVGQRLTEAVGHDRNLMPAHEEDPLRISRQIRLELLVERIAEKVFPV